MSIPETITYCIVALTAAADEREIICRGLTRDEAINMREQLCSKLQAQDVMIEREQVDSDSAGRAPSR
ncbi:MAG TPA: hypothetical protein VGM05_22690 [Planctomycetaceae bacterium]|jgi:hypothetical protein